MLLVIAYAPAPPPGGVEAVLPPDPVPIPSIVLLAEFQSDGTDQDALVPGVVTKVVVSATHGITPSHHHRLCGMKYRCPSKPAIAEPQKPSGVTEQMTVQVKFCPGMGWGHRPSVRIRRSVHQSASGRSIRVLKVRSSLVRSFPRYRLCWSILDADRRTISL